MDNARKVVWYEGMFLTPHHFQQGDRYYEKMLTERVRAFSPFGWGVEHIEMDTDGLANGNVTLLAFKGVMPDGVAIHIPDSDNSPEMRAIGALFPSTYDHLDVFLGIPSERLGVANCNMDQAATTPRSTRYTAEYMKVEDHNTGQNLHEIAVSRKNLKILVSGEEMTDYVTLKIAEVTRTAGGAFALRENYIPPCIILSASPYLMRLSKGLLEVLSTKCNALSGLREAAASGSADPLKFALLLTLQGYIPLLSHIQQVGAVHPEYFFLTLARLAGELTAFSGLYPLHELPSYQHTHLSRTFTELEQKIRVLVEGVSQAQYTTIPLVVQKENVWKGQILDERLFTTHQFFLVVTGDIPDEQIMEQVPRRYRVGSADELDVIISTALPGLRLYHVPRPPASLPVQSGRHYFRLDNHGEFWNSICRSKTVALYVPTDLKNMKVELWTIKA